MAASFLCGRHTFSFDWFRSVATLVRVARPLAAYPPARRDHLLQGYTVLFIVGGIRYRDGIHFHAEAFFRQPIPAKIVDDNENW